MQNHLLISIFGSFEITEMETGLKQTSGHSAFLVTLPPATIAASEGFLYPANSLSGLVWGISPIFPFKKLLVLSASRVGLHAPLCCWWGSGRRITLLIVAKKFYFDLISSTKLVVIKMNNVSLDVPFNFVVRTQERFLLKTFLTAQTSLHQRTHYLRVVSWIFSSCSSSSCSPSEASSLVSYHNKWSLF